MAINEAKPEKKITTNNKNKEERKKTLSLTAVVISFLCLYV